MFTGIRHLILLLKYYLLHLLHIYRIPHHIKYQASKIKPIDSLPYLPGNLLSVKPCITIHKGKRYLLSVSIYLTGSNG